MTAAELVRILKALPANTEVLCYSYGDIARWTVTTVTVNADGVMVE